MTAQAIKSTLVRAGNDTVPGGGPCGPASLLGFGRQTAIGGNPPGQGSGALSDVLLDRIAEHSDEAVRPGRPIGAPAMRCPRVGSLPLSRRYLAPATCRYRAGGREAVRPHAPRRFGV
jgi:hypothetical protein